MTKQKMLFPNQFPHIYDTTNFNQYTSLGSLERNGTVHHRHYHSSWYLLGHIPYRASLDLRSVV